MLHAHIPIDARTLRLFRALYLLHVGAREALGYALRFAWYEPLFRSQCESVGSDFWMERLPYMNGRGRIVIGDGVRLSGKSSITFFEGGDVTPELVIGDGSFIGHDCSLATASILRIGRHCLLAGGVRLHDFDGHPIDATRRRAREPTPREAIRPIVIEDDVWIGADARILKGVTVGARSIVGTGSVVTRSVPPDSIVAGNPARVVRRLEAAANGVGGVNGVGVVEGVLRGTG